MSTVRTKRRTRGGAKRKAPAAKRRLVPRGASRSTALPPVGGVRPQLLLAARDVQASAAWYAALLGLERTSIGMRSDHAHLYDRLLAGGELVLQLHAWDEENHPNLVNAAEARPGHGVLVWFEVDDFDAAVKRAKALDAEVLLEPHVNPRPEHREMWLADPDGYVVVIASPDGEAG